MEKFANKQEEILNIEYNICRLIKKALNSSDTLKEASNKLKVSERTLYRKMNEYEIRKIQNEYVIGKIPSYTLMLVQDGE